jgi:F-type H+-transporting ATPase subunit gamma
MAKARAISKRLQANRNIRKITRTMQLIATSKYQQSLNRATASRPFTDKVRELVEKMSAAAGEEIEHPLLRANEDAEKARLMIITSNRGLCGGYNAQLLRQAVAQYEENKAAGLETELYVVGKKGINYFNFIGYEMDEAYRDLGDAPTFDMIQPIAETFIRDYTAGKVTAIDIVYMKFVSTGRQDPTRFRLLPFEHKAADGETAEETGGTVQYDYSPPPAELLGELLPAAVKVELFQCFLDSIVSENVARMVAMKAATDAASDMIRSLSQQFNRARQTQITMELLDIVGGAEAIS